MPEEVSTTPRSPSLTYSEPRVAEPWSIESEADHLMEHLFTDVDLMLDGGSQLPTKPAQADFIALQTVVPAPLQVKTQPLAPGLQPSPAMQPPQQPQSAPPPPATPPKLQQRLRNNLDRLLFAIACVSFLGVLGWLLSQGKLNNGIRFQPTPNSQTVPEGAIATLPPEDAAFGHYMLRSMRAISRRPPQGYALDADPQERGVEELAAAPRDGDSNPQVIERIYLPVYPPSTAPRETAAAPPKPSPQPSPPTATPPQPSPSPAAVQPSPAPAPSTQASIPPPPQLPSLAWREMLPTVPPLDQEPAAAPVAPLPPGDHRLVGILEDGTRSTALLTIGEINQRVSPGEPIGDSGWVLVDTEGRQATVRRNGEVRSVYIGQPF
ncbi:hypothetical protein VB712_02350 [Spirulina sp. CCNP1310]|uniref:hypothetical protein n=1 Tax=Spirulina sp. CCNP1310 TaxID=3110249 RepID=UPI002B1F263B|nr:hypothetical protein [Spirulina sp. CCNP1310]MEA5418047.1 hypothetical protein [Spirulina sp. CCNP1310]